MSQFTEPFFLGVMLGHVHGVSNFPNICLLTLPPIRNLETITSPCGGGRTGITDSFLDGRTELMLAPEGGSRVSTPGSASGQPKAFLVAAQPLQAK